MFHLGIASGLLNAFVVRSLDKWLERDRAGRRCIWSTDWNRLLLPETTAVVRVLPGNKYIVMVAWTWVMGFSGRHLMEEIADSTGTHYCAAFCPAWWTAPRWKALFFAFSLLTGTVPTHGGRSSLRYTPRPTAAANARILVPAPFVVQAVRPGRLWGQTRWV